MTKPIRTTPLLPGTLQNLFYPPRVYTYFERAATLPFAGNTSLVKSAWAADASMLAYARRGETRMTDAELDRIFSGAGLQHTKIGNWSAPGPQAVFASCNNFAILAFRGTEPDDPADILTDADLIPAPEADHRHAATPGFFAHLIPPAFETNCFVHHGFQFSLNLVWQQVHDCITKYRVANPRAEICFTGHSLGAALAALAYSRFADPDLSLYTFGCPRVGNQHFADRLMSNPGQGIVRYVNESDTVAHVPTDSALYRQAPAQCERFDASGNISPDSTVLQADIDSLCSVLRGLPDTLRIGNLDAIPAPPGLVDHSPARYCFRLWDCV